MGLSAPLDSALCAPAYAHREGVGPRGGRVTFTSARCVDCGRAAEAQDPRAGSGDVDEALRRLRAVGPCARPYAPPPAERLLVEFARLLATRAPLRLPFAVEYAPDGDLDGAVQRAWQRCARGGVMVAVLMTAAARSWENAQRLAIAEAHEPLGVARAAAGGAVTLPDGVSVMINGPSAAVADDLRKLVPVLDWRGMLEARTGWT